MMLPMVQVENSLVTERRQVRLPGEADRPRFVELFCNEELMVFSNGAMSELEANLRFDGMLARSTEVSFAKQPIVERSSRRLVGYTRVDWIEFEDGRWLEWGYRLTPNARDKGYATEASAALLASAAQYWRQAPIQGEARDLYRLEV